MTFKFEIVNNSLVITNVSTTAILVDEPKQEVYYNNDKLQQGEVLIQKVSLPYLDNVLFRQDISSCVDATLTPFTESTFRQFAWENLGRSINAGSGGVDSVNGRTGDVVLTSNDVGLDNVDNTSDLNKPISTATQIALDNKQDILSEGAFVDGDKTKLDGITSIGSGAIITTVERTNLFNQSGVNTGDETTLSIQTKRPLKTIEGQSLEGTGNIDLDKTDVGLGNVDNTSDLNKPISIATQTEIDNLKNSTGWWEIDDNTFTGVSPQVIPSNTRTKLQINADAVVETYGANGLSASSIWDDTNYRITPPSIGDSYIFRVAFNADPVQNNRNLTVDLDVSGTTGIVFEKSFRLVRGAGNDTKVDITSSVFALSDFVTNGGEIYVTCDGSISLSDIKLYIQKVTQND